MENENSNHVFLCSDSDHTIIPILKNILISVSYYYLPTLPGTLKLQYLVSCQSPQRQVPVSLLPPQQISTPRLSVELTHRESKIPLLQLSSQTLVNYAP
ncbi:unnamed protein product, partial [Nesidiocoris tenuis]